ncbi:hypothetical protein B277_10394 [Janibacter hoylei PVAS-1]|uniref:Uncharacterized protein n=1 Tax=Janibacter hoylei PVAS-1 TaxID=1210046 RepID=K1DWI5_9MICO|nr:hypothetical protein B277_10394 [Janibacter hoylei PVAS-1]RWU84493.1 hypothetical protein CWN80_04930 [Janibacter hoylei PVAS-1]
MVHHRERHEFPDEDAPGADLWSARAGGAMLSRAGSSMSKLTTSDPSCGLSTGLVIVNCQLHDVGAVAALGVP